MAMVEPNDILELFASAGIDVDPQDVVHDEPLGRYGVDSMDVAGLIFEIERRYGLTVHPEDSAGLSTLEDVTALVNRLQG